MRVDQVMTRGVKCVGPDTTLSQAAKAMARINIGVTPVVRDGRPIGIITDRDITTRAIARGLDPDTTPVRRVMTRDVIACEEADSLDEAIRAMESRRVRRVPVIGRSGRLAGILSLGDLAVRTRRDEIAARALERISESGRPRFGGLPGLSPRSAGGRAGGFGRDVGAAAGSVVGVVGVAAASASVMYLLDPARGRRRRGLIRDQFVHYSRILSDGLSKAARDTAYRAQGVVAEARARLSHEIVDDDRLCARVRSALGRAVSHPGAIHVEARDGTVTLTGAVLQGEVPRLAAILSRVRGVRALNNQFQAFAEPGDHPSLQGGRTRREPAAIESWTPSTRLMAGAAGAGLIGWGLGHRGALGMLASLAGAGLALRCATNLPAKRLVGIGAGRRAVDVQKTITIGRPAAEVFEFFRYYENFPHVMRHVREVRDLGEGRSHWVVEGPAGLNVEWDAETIHMEPGRVLSWRSVPGSLIQNYGAIRFQDLGDGRTRVDIKLSYNPPGGALGHLAAKLFGADPRSEMNDDLMRAKVLIETGHLPHDAAKKVGAP